MKFVAFLEMISKKDADWNLWEWLGFFGDVDTEEYKTMPFNDVQKKTLAILIKSITDTLDFHEKFEDSHEETILKKQKSLKITFEQHRHAYRGTYTSKPEG